jgi:hypothetical protein
MGQKNEKNDMKDLTGGGGVEKSWGQECWGRTVGKRRLGGESRRRQSGQEREDRAAKTWQHRQVSWNRTAVTGQLLLDNMATGVAM